MNTKNLRTMARSVKGFWHYQMKNLALDARIIPGRTDYTHYLILGRSRTGSNLLRGLLNSHPDVVAFNELYRTRELISWGVPYFPQSPSLLALRDKDPVGFLNSKVFGRYPRNIAAVGFKIFYYHAQDATWKVLWEHLLQRRDIHVIHIKRENMLRTHLSRKRAEITDKWMDRSGTHGKNPPVTIDFDECLRDFETTRAWERDFDALFQHHPKIVVNYEQLAKDYVGESGRILDFLGVRRIEVQPMHHRQSRTPISQQITNYGELKTQFAGTPWASFFEE